MKRYSAIDSRRFHRDSLSVCIAENEKRHDKDRKSEINAEKSSIKLDSVRSAICIEVMMIKQKPRRFADVLSICGEFFCIVYECEFRV